MRRRYPRTTRCCCTHSRLAVLWAQSGAVWSGSRTTQASAVCVRPHHPPRATRRRACTHRVTVAGRQDRIMSDAGCLDASAMQASATSMHWGATSAVCTERRLDCSRTRTSAPGGAAHTATSRCLTCTGTCVQTMPLACEPSAAVWKDWASRRGGRADPPSPRSRPSVRAPAHETRHSCGYAGRYAGWLRRYMHRATLGIHGCKYASTQ